MRAIDFPSNCTRQPKARRGARRSSISSANRLVVNAEHNHRMICGEYARHSPQITPLLPTAELPRFTSMFPARADKLKASADWSQALRVHGNTKRGLDCQNGLFLD